MLDISFSLSSRATNGVLVSYCITVALGERFRAYLVALTVEQLSGISFPKTHESAPNGGRHHESPDLPRLRRMVVVREMRHLPSMPSRFRSACRRRRSAQGRYSNTASPRGVLKLAMHPSDKALQPVLMAEVLHECRNTLAARESTEAERDAAHRQATEALIAWEATQKSGGPQ